MGAAASTRPAAEVTRGAAQTEEPGSGAVGLRGTGQKPVEKPGEKKLKNHLSDTLRGELSDPARGTLRLQTVTHRRVRCSAWLGHGLIINLQTTQKNLLGPAVQGQRPAQRRRRVT